MTMRHEFEGLGQFDELYQVLLVKLLSSSDLVSCSLLFLVRASAIRDNLWTV